MCVYQYDTVYRLPNRLEKIQYIFNIALHAFFTGTEQAILYCGIISYTKHSNVLTIYLDSQQKIAGLRSTDKCRLNFLDNRVFTDRIEFEFDFSLYRCPYGSYVTIISVLTIVCGFRYELIVCRFCSLKRRKPDYNRTLFRQLNPLIRVYGRGVNTGRKGSIAYGRIFPLSGPANNMASKMFVVLLNVGSHPGLGVGIFNFSTGDPV